MALNDYRRDRKQVSFVVDESLWAAVKGCAAVRGCSVTRLITELLEKEVGHGVAGVGSGDSEGSGASGSVHGAHGGGSGGSNLESGSFGRGVDWDALLRKPVREPQPVTVPTSDPLEDIA